MGSLTRTLTNALVRPALAMLCAVVAFVGATTSVMAASRGPAGRDHHFSASYSGHGSGQAAGTSASGSATMRGRGSLIGRGKLSGSGQGSFTSQTCVTFNGRAVVSGTRGSLRLRARSAHACAAAGGNNVSFSGTASVTGGTGTFVGARGRLSFAGSFDKANGRVRISLTGTIRYRG